MHYFWRQRREFEEAEKYAERARDADGYNAPALVNLGNCCFQRGDLEKAKEYYICALDNDASCVQALYNLGMTLTDPGGAPRLRTPGARRSAALSSTTGIRTVFQQP